MILISSLNNRIWTRIMAFAYLPTLNNRVWGDLPTLNNRAWGDLSTYIISIIN